VSSAKSSRQCLFPSSAFVGVTVGRHLIAHVANVARCGSSWSCPVCAPVVRQRRADEIDQGLQAHLDGGGGAVFLTTTLRHARRDALATRLSVIVQALHLILQGSGWRRRRDRLGYIGAIRAVEITYSLVNGWHPHLHAVLLFERPLTADELADLEAWIFGRWSAIALRKGLGSVTREHGIDLRPVTTAGDLAGYLTKVEGGWGAGMEIARADLKRSGGGLTPVEILEGFVATGDVEMLTLWQEYERATFGRRSIMWSPGLRDRLIPHIEDQADEDIAAAEGADEPIVSTLIEAALWRQALAVGATGEILTQIERGAAVVWLLCDSYGVPVTPLAQDREREP
jgi:hypothetical protein